MRLAATSLLTIPAFLLMSSPPPAGIKVQVNGGAIQTVTQLNFVNGGNTTVAVKPSNGIALIRYNAPAPLNVPVTAAPGMQSISTFKGACQVGQTYFDANQRPNQQLFTCAAANQLVQQNSLYDTSLLIAPNGALYVNTGVIASLGDAQTFTGLKKFSQSFDVAFLAKKPEPPPPGFFRVYGLTTDNALHYETADGVQH